MYLNFSIFTVFLKNRNIIFKMKISKVTDYAALMHWYPFIVPMQPVHIDMTVHCGGVGDLCYLLNNASTTCKTKQ